MADYRKHLGKRKRFVAPYIQGPRVEGSHGSFRLSEQVQPGFYLFEQSGRVARPLERIETPNLTNLASVRGHMLGELIVGEAARTAPLNFVRGERLPRFSPVIARRWHSGDLLFECRDFESDAEETVRRAYEDGKSLGTVASVPATLRAAFAYAVAVREGERLAIPCTPAEVRPWVREIADEGAVRAETCLVELQRRRALHHRDRVARHRTGAPGQGDDAYVDSVLRAAGARLCDIRLLEGELLEVRYEFLGTRFGTLVERNGLRVVDAGICLQGADSQLTLDSLPGVVREAIESNQLVLTWEH